MTKKSGLAWISVLLLAVLAAGGAAQAATLASVAWLEGCWEAVSPKGTIEENWTAARGHTMIGVSRTVSGDSLFGYELLILRERSDGLAYEAHPSGQAPAVFLSTEATDTTAVFEDLKHDFPQRLRYWRVGADSLVARLEGSMGGTERRIAFSFRRVRCAGR